MFMDVDPISVHKHIKKELKYLGEFGTKQRPEVISIFILIIYLLASLPKGKGKKRINTV